MLLHIYHSTFPTWGNDYNKFNDYNIFLSIIREYFPSNLIHFIIYNNSLGYWANCSGRDQKIIEEKY